jgi:GNAT superfamily N-acetyltransferase
MPSAPRALPNIVCHPVDADRWPDLEALFGPRGACGGCWCMWWRLKRPQFVRQKGEENRNALKQMIEAGGVPGLLAYVDGQPIGWCAVAPRESYGVLERSRLLKRIDEAPVWSVVCFFVSKGFRGKGLTVELLRAAVDYATRHGAQIVEGYPVDPKKARMPDVFAYTGLAAAYRKAGFVEVARRSETRPIMRYVVGDR